MSRLSIVLICLATLLFAGRPCLAQGTEVDVRLDVFGIGGAFRPGDFTAVRLGLLSNMEEPASAWVQWEMPNADGDIVEYGRAVTLTPQRESLVWLYAPLSPTPATTSGSVWPVRVFRYEDGRRGGDLGGQRISPASARTVMPVRMETGLIGVIGQPNLGLDDLSAAFAGTSGRPPAAHEDTQLVLGIRPTELPDRWEGLRLFEAIAWGDANRETPQDLTGDAAHALRDYVQRGGHLIIMLPEAGNPWGLGATSQAALHDLQDLLPVRAPRKDEAVPLKTLLPILAKSSFAPANPQLSIRVFRDLRGSFDAIDNHYEPLIALPDGRVVVVQRTFGFGTITVIGIDLANRTLLSMGLPQGDVFWNRVLGRRADTPPGQVLRALRNANRDNTRAKEQDLGGGQFFLDQINMAGRAEVGIGLALLLFAGYWLVAGPGGFALLKRYRQVKHAWLAFAATAALFTAIAWGGVELLRDDSVAVRHFTFLDQLARPGGDRGDADPQLQRATSFLSVYLPGYLNASVELTGESDQRDLLVNWTPPAAPNQPFPNTDRYSVDVGRSPAAYTVPARATATQMYASWLGALPGDWGGTFFADPNQPVRVIMQGEKEVSLAGIIHNDLPAPLTNVMAIWIQSDRTGRRRYEQGDDALPVVPKIESGQMLNTGRMWALNGGQIEPGESVDLAQSDLSGRTTLVAENIKKMYAEPLRDAANAMGTGQAEARRQFPEMLSLFHQIDPPVYFRQRANEPEESSAAIQRIVGRELDLSNWFNRPCLIIIGELREADLPIPLKINGRLPATEDGSRTMVRWIHPLPLNERLAFRQVFEGSSGTP